MLQDAPIRLGEGAVGQAAVTREPVQVPDLREAQFRSQYRLVRVLEALEQSGQRALLAVPLLREDRILGGLVLHRKTTGEFSPEVVALTPVRVDVYIPTMMLRVGYRWCADALSADCTTLRMIGRLAAGRTLRDANAEFATAGVCAESDCRSHVSVILL